MMSALCTWHTACVHIHNQEVSQPLTKKLSIVKACSLFWEIIGRRDRVSMFGVLSVNIGSVDVRYHQKRF